MPLVLINPQVTLLGETVWDPKAASAFPKSMRTSRAPRPSASPRSTIAAS